MVGEPPSAKEELERVRQQQETSFALSTSIPASFVSIQTSSGLCSAFAVAPDRIATARHCIDNPQAVTVVPQSGDRLCSRRKTHPCKTWDSANRGSHTADLGTSRRSSGDRASTA